MDWIKMVTATLFVILISSLLYDATNDDSCEKLGKELGIYTFYINLDGCYVKTSEHTFKPDNHYRFNNN